ncbi:MAG: rhodanese-like domain-containing protein [Acidimicrobiia bacterium]|nr:rhodanese-like domain-containing protein [Acidimicrobiia bacterium]
MRPREVVARGKELLILDVREPDEWRAGRIEGARHIPMGELPSRLGELNGNPVVVVCRSGNRSEQVTRFLRARGFAAENLDGGMLAWQQEGLPIASPVGRPGWVA